mmetsp:Transcript_3913/g.12223  ORF Transcript_3913/g.12223 Transcript_3913/m.12223 type:complete len:345 (+) Transcript_3913:546-1580(+)
MPSSSVMALSGRGPFWSFHRTMWFGRAVKYTRMSMLATAPTPTPYSMPRKVHPKKEIAHGTRSIFETCHSWSGSLQLNIFSTDTIIMDPREALEMYCMIGVKNWMEMSTIDPVTRPAAGVATPVAELTAVRENEPVTGYACTKKLTMLLQPIATNSWVVLISYPLDRANADAIATDSRYPMRATRTAPTASLLTSAPVTAGTCPSLSPAGMVPSSVRQCIVTCLALLHTMSSDVLWNIFTTMMPKRTTKKLPAAPMNQRAFWTTLRFFLTSIRLLSFWHPMVSRMQMTDIRTSGYLVRWRWLKTSYTENWNWRRTTLDEIPRSECTWPHAMVRAADVVKPVRTG